jgi:addiction module RelE/StbE family toxin
MGQVKWTEKAQKHLKDLHDYIAKDSILYAQRFIRSLINSSTILEKNPYAGRMVPEFDLESIREIIFRNYRIVYRVQNNKDIEILAVYSGARDFYNMDFF